MRISDVFGYSFSAIKLRKLRAGLTTLGVVIGIAAIVALLSITQGLQNTITMQLETGLSADTLIVSPGRGIFGGTGTGLGGGGFGGSESDFKLFVNDTTLINDLSPDIEASVAIIQKTIFLKFNESDFAITITGVDFAQYSSTYSNTFVSAKGAIDLNPNNLTVAIGQRIHDPWQNGTLLYDVGDSIGIRWINATARPPENKTYTGQVAAVLKEVGGFGFGGPSDAGVYIPISQAEFFFGTDECAQIIVKLSNSNQATIESVSKIIRDAFSREVSVVSSTAVLDILGSVFSIVQLFLVGIAAISLLVAGIGIMNIMIVSLIERTREIGILKALGMKSRTVLLIFLGESIIIGLIGAMIGIGLGWVLANVVAVVFGGGGPFAGMGGGQTAASGTGAMRIVPVLTPTVFAGAMIFGIGVSVIFAIYPAWRASKLKPVEALRYE